MSQRLLDIAQKLASLSNSDEILATSCREVAAWPGAPRAYASCCLPRQSWERGVHIEVDGTKVRSAAPAARSALFAIQRRLAMANAAIELERSGEPAIFDGLAPAGETLHAVPIVHHRTGRLWGSLVLLDGATIYPEATQAARHAAIALENAQRLAFARRDQDRLVLLAEATDDALYDYDMDAKEFWWGGGIVKLFGGEVEHTLRWKRAQIHPDDLARVVASFEAAHDVRRNVEYRFRRNDGSYIDVEDRAYFLRDARGRAYRMIGSMRDVTAVKQLLAREQEARAEAESANRAKDEFLAMLGHELRNPLAPIVTGLEILKMRGSLDVDKDLPVLQRQAQHLIRLVDDLLDISRIAHGKVELRKERLGLASIVASAIETASPLIEARRHAIDRDVPDCGLELFGDRARLVQTIANLLTNAAKYTEPGGRITITARRAPEMIELVVRDTGIGIDPEMLPHVFTMFVQERQALDRSQGGLGLGLSIVRSLVELHGGTVQAASEGRGRGSTFTVRLPAATADAPAAAHEASFQRVRPATGRRILVVDDNEDAADLLSALLERVGNITRVAHDARGALQLAEELAPDVAILDIGLPGVDGYELARQLRERFTGRMLHLIALTGYGQSSDKERAAQAGFDAHLVKPVSLDTLYALIAQLPSATQAA